MKNSEKLTTVIHLVLISGSLLPGDKEEILEYLFEQRRIAKYTEDHIEPVEADTNG